MQNMKLVIAILAIAGGASALKPDYAQPAAAPNEAYFGTEMTFAVTDIDQKRLDPNVDGAYLRTQQPTELKGKWQAAVDALCKKSALCTVAKEVNEFTGKEDVHVKFKADAPYYGFWYVVNTDNFCIELQTRPSTLKQLTALQPALQEYVFKIAEGLGLAPHRYLGNGHVHIDANTAFASNPVMFLNFMTDIHNLPLFPMIRLPDMILNSPALTLAVANPGTRYTPAQTRKAQREAYKAIVDNVKANGGQFKVDGKSYTGDEAILQIADAIKKTAYTDTIYVSSKANAAKYQTINLNTFGFGTFKPAKGTVKQRSKEIPAIHKATVEIRSLGPQRSAQDLINVIGLLQGAISSTEKANVVDYLNAGKEVPVTTTVQKGQTVLTLSKTDSAAAAAAFKAYVKKAGLKKLSAIAHHMPIEIAEAWVEAKLAKKAKTPQLVRDESIEDLTLLTDSKSK